jgi:hypothetical protein
MVGLWQRRFAKEDAEHAESCCFLCVLGVLGVLGGFPDPFRKILKNPLDQTGDDTAKSSEKFKQAFMEAFGQTENGSAKPPGRLQQMFQQILLWRSRIG